MVNLRIDPDSVTLHRSSVPESKEIKDTGIIANNNKGNTSSISPLFHGRRNDRVLNTSPWIVLC